MVVQVAGLEGQVLWVLRSSNDSLCAFDMLAILLVSGREFLWPKVLAAFMFSVKYLIVFLILFFK